MTSVIFMGTPQFAVPILQALLDDDRYSVKAVLTQPDRRVGRKHKLTASPVKQLASQAGIQIFQPEKLIKSEELEALINLHADLIITAAYGQFLPSRLLESAKIAAINVHGSLLPKYRGGAPIQYAVMNGDTETGVSIMYMVKKMDAGDVIAQRSIPIEATDDAGTMFEKLSLLGRNLLMEVLPDLIAGKIKAVPQAEDQVVFSPNITTEQEWIDYTLPARLIDAKVRGLRPKPLGKMMIDGVATKLIDVTPLAEQTQQAPGTIVRVEKHALVIAAGNGTTYRINQLKPAGKPAMEITAYLNGHQGLEVGRQIITNGKH